MRIVIVEKDVDVRAALYDLAYYANPQAVIASYDSFRRMLMELGTTHWDVLVLDHYTYKISNQRPLLSTQFKMVVVLSSLAEDFPLDAGPRVVLSKPVNATELAQYFV